VLRLQVAGALCSNCVNATSFTQGFTTVVQGDITLTAGIPVASSVSVAPAAPLAYYTPSSGEEKATVSSTESTGLIIGCVIGAIVLGGIVGVVVWKYCYSDTSDTSSNASPAGVAELTPSKVEIDLTSRGQGRACCVPDIDATTPPTIISDRAFTNCDGDAI